MAFIVKVLAPSIYKFNSLYPDINIQISSSFDKPDFQNQNLDVAIIFGRTNGANYKTTKLFEEILTPMCSPRLLGKEKTNLLNNPVSLFQNELIHDDSLKKFGLQVPDWETWTRSYGINSIDHSIGSRFSQPDHALQAAIDGKGIVLGRKGLASIDLAANRLVQTFHLSLPVGLAYYLVYPKAYDGRSEVSIFREWLVTN